MDRLRGYNPSLEVHARLPLFGDRKVSGSQRCDRPRCLDPDEDVKGPPRLLPGAGVARGAPSYAGADRGPTTRERRRGLRPEFEAPVFPPITPDPAATRLGRETSLRQWLTSFLDSSGAPGANPSLLLAANFKRQYRFIGLIDGERYEVQVVEPDIKDPKLRYHEQSNRFAYTETLNGGCVLLHAAGQNFGFQGLYVIPQIVNPAALSKAAPDTWHIPAKGAGTDAKDILAFLVSYADFDTVREGGAKKVSATDTEMMISASAGSASTWTPPTSWD